MTWLADRLLVWILNGATFKLIASPTLSQRYGEANPGTTAHERNLFAQGALWWADELNKRVEYHKANSNG